MQRGDGIFRSRTLVPYDAIANWLRPLYHLMSAARFDGILFILSVWAEFLSLKIEIMSGIWMDRILCAQCEMPTNQRFVVNQLLYACGHMYAQRIVDENKISTINDEYKRERDGRKWKQAKENKTFFPSFRCRKSWMKLSWTLFLGLCVCVCVSVFHEWRYKNRRFCSYVVRCDGNRIGEKFHWRFHFHRILHTSHACTYTHSSRSSAAVCECVVWWCLWMRERSWWKVSLYVWRVTTAKRHGNWMGSKKGSVYLAWRSGTRWCTVCTHGHGGDGEDICAVCCCFPTSLIIFLSFFSAFVFMFHVFMFCAFEAMRMCKCLYLLLFFFSLLFASVEVIFTSFQFRIAEQPQHSSHHFVLDKAKKKNINIRDVPAPLVL